MKNIHILIFSLLGSLFFYNVNAGVVTPPTTTHNNQPQFMQLALNTGKTCVPTDSKKKNGKTIISTKCKMNK